MKELAMQPGGAECDGGLACGADEGGDVMTSAPTLETVLGRAASVGGEAGDVVARRLVAFGSLPALAGETLEACVERHLASGGGEARP